MTVPAHASNPAAIIENYEDVSSYIAIERNSGEYGGESVVYNNDVITVYNSSVRVGLDLAPYASVTSSGSTYTIHYDPPTGIKAIIWHALNQLYSYWKNWEYVVIAASRGAVTPSPQLTMPDLRPGENVTLLLKQRVKFTWSEPMKGKFVIYDKNGKSVFSKKISGVNEVEIVPAEVGLTAGEEYTWSAGNTRHKFKMLSQDNNDAIMTQLNSIDKADMSETERIIKKAEYVQYISDTFPEEADLYWLSAQWLTENNMSEKKDENDLLLRKCVQHFTEKAREEK